MHLQICIDCDDPHALADFWAAGFGYEVEKNDELIRQLLDGGQITQDEVIDFGDRLAFKVGAGVSHPTLPRLLFQHVPEAKQVKNRVHVDIKVDDKDATVAKLLELGATKLWDGQQGPTTWVTMADPEGNEFCVVG